MQREDERVDWAMVGGLLKMDTVAEVATTREGSIMSITSEARMWEANIGGEAMKNMGMGITTIRSRNQTLMWN